ncbi:MAG: S8 family serine peptidase [Proteobacteria bacterium]|nr:S8 family serine peptidase [Pseudomonadota bacterium]
MTISSMVERAAPRQPEQKLSPELRRVLSAAPAGRKLSVLVDLSEQLDLHRAVRAVSQQHSSRRKRRELVVAALTRLAGRSQARLVPLLEQFKQRGWVEGYRSFAIVNRFVVSGTPAAVRALAARDEVAAIEIETPEGMRMPSGPTEPAADARSSWAIPFMGVDKAWQRGLTGRGVVVGIIDTGVSSLHQQLRGNFRGGDNSWYDPTGRRSSPRDAAKAHGTQVLSAAVAQNAGGWTMGVAPGAQWVACSAFPDERYNNVLITECADWMLRVGQPDVLICPWLLPGHDEHCNPALRRIVGAWRAAEIFPVFAAGNWGPDPSSDGSPANYVGLPQGDGRSFAVGGLRRDGSVYPSSSRGPNSCDGSSYPTVAVPAEDLIVALPLTPTTHMRSKGTSIAAGLAAGAVALLLQSAPESTLAELHAALQSGIVDIGPPGADNLFGHGRLWVPHAVAALAGSPPVPGQTAKTDAGIGQSDQRSTMPRREQRR